MKIFILILTLLYPMIQAQAAPIGQVIGFRLIKGGSRTVFANLTDGAVIQIPPNTPPNFNIEAVAAGGPIASILFGYNSITSYRVEKTAPYSLCGDNAGIFKGCTPPDLGLGAHRVNATITNTGRSSSVRFQIVAAAAPSAPTPVRAPMQAPVALPTAVPPTRITFTFIYTVNNTDIMRLVNGSVVNVNNFAEASFNLRADAINKTAIQSIRFLPNNRILTGLPWSYCGATVNGTRIQYRKCAEFSVEGLFTITARPYSGRNLTGTQLPDETVYFYMVGQPQPPVQTGFPLYINCGGPNTSDSQGRTWMADTYFSNGKTYSNSAVDIVNTVDDAIYQSERYGNSVYQIPVPTGSYSVLLHLAET
jgi:hypothetical protein